MTRSQARIIIMIVILIGAIYRLWPRPPRQAPPASDRGARRERAAPRQPGAPSRTSESPDLTNLLLGKPSDASTSPDDYLVEHRKFTLSYNQTRGGPNWVSWHLEKSDLGEVERTNAFMPDPLLPEPWRIRPSEYAGSVYDRGHMCPSGDRTSSEDDNRETFVMSNMLPQTGDLNRQVWEGLESDCRDSVKKGMELYIIAGGEGQKQKSIAQGKVRVPDTCWKVFIALPEGVDDLQRLQSLDKDAYLRAVEIPNKQGIASHRWNEYITKRQKIEAATGCHFFSKLPKETLNTLETRQGIDGMLGAGKNDDEPRPSRRKRTRPRRDR